MGIRRGLAGYRLIGALLVALGLTAALTMPALAAAPDVNTGAAITVDGNFADWTDADFFADMYRAGDPEKQVESKLFLRYDCTTGILYVGVVAAQGVTIIASDGDNFVKFGDSDKKVDGDDAPPDATQPNFAYAAEGAGWEASFAVGQVSIPDLNVHAQVQHDGSQTSAVADRAIPMEISCEQGGEEQSARLTIVKDADGEAGTSFSFGSFSLTDGEDETITLDDEDLADGPVEVTVTEELTETQEEDELWSLDAITCDTGTWDDDLDSSSVTVTLSDGDDVTCTFFNVQDREGTQGGNPSGGGKLPDTSAPFEPLPAAAVSLLLFGALGAMLIARLATRRA